MMRRLPRPAPRTPLQRALVLFAAAFREASTDERTKAAFLDVVIARVAAEAVERVDQERRP